MKRLYFASAALLMAIVTVFTGLAPALAATSSNSSTGTNVSGQALEIAPPVITLTVNPGQTVNTQISIRDISSGNLIVTGQANDFVAAGEDGTPKILLNGDEGNNPYSLKDWVQSLPQLLLIPKQIKTLPVTIKVPSSASPGGHYGVIRFTATPPELKGTGVSLSASLGALVLLTVRGDIKDQLSVAEFSVNKDGKTGHIFQSTPLNFVEKIKNTGNVHEEPSGIIIVKDLFGKAVASVSVNQANRNVLPGSIRKFSEPLDKTSLGTRRLFGRYKATMTLHYGPNKKDVLVATATFWIIPYKMVGAAILLLIGGFFLLRTLLRNHDKRMITRMQKMQAKQIKNKKKD